MAVSCLVATISGKEALIALANGDEVELQINGDMNWHDSTQWTVGELLCFKGRFRLKPRIITLNGIELPAPFKPKEGDEVWFLDDDSEVGYSCLANYEKDIRFILVAGAPKMKLNKLLQLLQECF